MNRKLLIFLLLGAFTLKTFAEELPSNLIDSNQWIKTEEIHKKNLDILNFDTKNGSGSEKLKLVFEKVPPHKKNGNANDLFSLMFPDYEPLTSLGRMREIRLLSKKQESPYSSWKLLLASSENDIIYSSFTPPLGPYQEKYQWIRLVKQAEGFLSIIYEIPTPPSQEKESQILSYLENLPI
ncbi:MAG: hypothetical protein FJZ63_02875 [Chlamydiae bacterium]|nr:hypothetical protein [Chlamydiota bacterium]